MHKGMTRQTAPLQWVVTYARVSSKDQEKEGFSIPAQQRLLREYAADKGMGIAQEFVDVETARKSGREGFGQMLALHHESRVITDCVAHAHASFKHQIQQQPERFRMSGIIHACRRSA